MHVIPLKSHVFQGVSPLIHSFANERFIVRLMIGIFVAELITCAFIVRGFLLIDEVSYASAVEIRHKPGAVTEQFMADLSQGGINAVVVGHEISREPFSAPGVLLTVDGDNIQVFQYDDHETAVQEASLFGEQYKNYSRAHASPEAIRLYVRDTLVIFYMGNDEKIIEALNTNAELFVMEPRTLPTN